MKYHESQVTFFKDPNKTETDKLMEECKKRVGHYTYSDVTKKHGTIIEAKMIGHNVFIKVGVKE
jgi:hypothetical protein